MRYLLPLLLIPSTVFASCAVGVNYGSKPIGSPSSMCVPYSGSSLGGCTAVCTGVCLELPAAGTVGPYMSDGSECKYGNGDGNTSGNGDGNTSGNGDGNGGGKDPNWNPSVSPFPDTNSTIRTGGPNQEMVTAGLSVLDSDFKRSANFMAERLAQIGGSVHSNTMSLDAVAQALKTQSMFAESNGRYYQTMQDYLAKIYNNTLPQNGGGISSGTSGATGTLPSKEFDQDRLFGTLDAINGGVLHNIDMKMSGLKNHLAGIEGSLGANGMSGNVYAIRQMMENGSGSTGGETGGNTGGNTGGGAEQTQYLKDISESVGYMAEDVLSIKKSLDGSGTGNGDKPCEGPLCSFTTPSGGSGSALSTLFDDESLGDIKKRIDDKDQEIKDQMTEIKKVFAPDEITIEGEYNEDVQTIHGVKVDLSGKSNLELFFNSGPKQALWFLFVLIAFTVLMGGRKNA